MSMRGTVLALVLAVALLAGAYTWGHHQGAAAVQGKWDAANGAQSAIAVEASEMARDTEQQQSNDFAGIASGYLQATNHAYPSLADALPAAVDAGTVRLRDACPPARGGGVPLASAAARAADAAATQALADRVQAAIAAVRAGDEADARERLLGVQVTGLQALLAAERKPLATHARPTP